MTPEASPTVVILGCGYTGARVARRFLKRGFRVIGTSRDPERLRDIEGLEPRFLDVMKDFSLDFLPQRAFVLHSIPPVEDDNPTAITSALGERPQRVVYLSTTGVYGDQRDVDISTTALPRSPRDRQRLAAEEAILNGPWSSVVLRPAAIYGPGRGIHASMAEGRFRLVNDGENFVSRIHVDDLAAHAEAALLQSIAGAWPVADDHPCTQREIAQYCAELLHTPMPESIPADQVHHTRRADRRVEGRAIREQLGISLIYPSYLQGIPASLKKS